MDFQTQCRLHGYKFYQTERPKPSATYRDLYRETCPHVFHSERVQSHDCRREVMQEFSEKNRWEAWMFSHGLQEVYNGVNALHTKEKEEDEKAKKPNKLLFEVGIEGSLDGDFRYPRGLAVDENDDIIIADSANHRIQRFNQCAVFKEKFGKKGMGDGEFNYPTGVAVMLNGDLAVADRKNKRIQVFDASGKFKYKFPTKHEPYSVTVDTKDNIIVGTVARSIEIYNENGDLIKQWRIGPVNGTLSIVWVSVNLYKDEIYVSDPEDKKVKCYTDTGKLLYQFEPDGGESTAVHPNAIAINDTGQIILVDGLNHTVNLYDDKGTLLNVILGPVDDTGSVQAIAPTFIGHLVVTEFTCNGPHCLKVFRYRDCECHRTKPPSSKRRTPTTPIEDEY